MDRASAEVAEEAEWDETEEKVRSGEEYEEMAGVAGIEGEGDEDRMGGEVTSASVDCGPSILNLETVLGSNVLGGEF